jgi:hypothetical protein
MEIDLRFWKMDLKSTASPLNLDGCEFTTSIGTTDGTALGPLQPFAASFRLDRECLVGSHVLAVKLPAPASIDTIFISPNDYTVVGRLFGVLIIPDLSKLVKLDQNVWLAAFVVPVDELRFYNPGHPPRLLWLHARA